MSGYRRHSYDPNVYDQPGKPLKPYNWVQWTGVAFAMLGLAAFGVHLAGAIGWIDPVLDEPTFAFLFSLIGALLINSRREPGTPVGSEQLARNRKVLLVAIGVLAVLFAILLALQLSGAL
ncbi:hypothetical protein H8M03_06200 [Sphingomonas sabuli]|uniref:Uncharacterized protein n=1 Tax=Sphingomonas sabuli TaxID=2764186 RepID=A0A7G9L5J7_9SPHN|nr:hypothetical protein [Sphingomonas sabuli]QNM83896.1 hypothetical protein H8M03_06200 [Sphingomonas sabuli]